MQFSRYFTRRNIIIAAGVLVVLLATAVAAFEPVTRNLVSSDALCSYCHLEWEYDPQVRLSWSKPMLAEPGGTEIAHCVDCHIPKGLAGSFFAYLHYASISDFFGRIRDIDGERRGTWMPQRAKTAYRVRDALFEADSVTCRNCHVLAEIKPKRKMGQKQHKKALDKNMTCIACHTNLVHRTVGRRKTAFKKAEVAK